MPRKKKETPQPVIKTDEFDSSDSVERKYQLKDKLHTLSQNPKRPKLKSFSYISVKPNF